MDLPKDILNLVEILPDIPGASISFNINEGIKVSIFSTRLSIEIEDWSVIFAIDDGKLTTVNSYPSPIEEHLLEGEFEHLLTKLELIRFLIENKKSFCL